MSDSSTGDDHAAATRTATTSARDRASRRDVRTACPLSAGAGREDCGACEVQQPTSVRGISWRMYCTVSGPAAASVRQVTSPKKTIFRGVLALGPECHALRAQTGVERGTLNYEPLDNDEQLNLLEQHSRKAKGV